MSQPEPSAGPKAMIVVCEGDSVTLELLCEHLVADRYSVVPASSAADALRLLRFWLAEVLVLDLGLPEGSAFELLREIRDDAGAEPGSSPLIIALSPHGDEDARDRARELGPAELIAKPFHYRDLRDRIEALLRRRGVREEAVIEVAGLRIESGRQRVSVDGREVALSAKEFALLRILVSDPVRVFSKQELLEEVWGFRSETRTCTLDAHASRLRRKLDPEHARYVVNCWGVGFRLLDHSAAGAG